MSTQKFVYQCSQQLVSNGQKTETTHMSISSKMDYVLVDLYNVMVYSGKDEITCIHNIDESHKYNVCLKGARHKRMHSW